MVLLVLINPWTCFSHLVHSFTTYLALDGFLNNRIIEQLSLEGSSAGHLVQLLTQSKVTFQVESGCSGTCLAKFWKSSGIKMAHLLTLCSSAWPHTLQRNFLCYNLWPLYLLILLHITEKSVAPSSPLLSIIQLKTVIRFLFSLLQADKSMSLSLSSCVRCSRTLTILAALHWTLSSLLVSLVLKVFKLDKVFHIPPDECSRGE